MAVKAPAEEHNLLQCPDASSADTACVGGTRLQPYLARIIKHYAKQQVAGLSRRRLSPPP